MSNVATLISQSTLVAAFIGASLPASAATSMQEKASCTVRDAPAALSRVIPVEAPPIAQLAHLSGTARVKIDLASNGVASNPRIVESTGSDLLDRAALKSVLEQTFTPEVRDCVSVPGSYAVEVEFPN
jgi:TonB family protein